VPHFVASGAQRNQVGRHIITKAAPKFQMMNLQILEGTALLAPPIISFQYLTP
jgi:hypothetical protein